jgi:hypothetical protein
MEYPKPVKSAQRILYFAENSSNLTCFSCIKIANYSNKIKKPAEYVFTRAEALSVTELTQLLSILAMAAARRSSIPVLYPVLQGLHAVPAFLHFYFCICSRARLNT